MLVQNSISSFSSAKLVKQLNVGIEDIPKLDGLTKVLIDNSKTE